MLQRPRAIAPFILLTACNTGAPLQNPDSVSSEAAPRELLGTYVAEVDPTSDEVRLTEVTPGGLTSNARAYRNLTVTSGKSRFLSNFDCDGPSSGLFTFPLSIKNSTVNAYEGVVVNVAQVTSSTTAWFHGADWYSSDYYELIPDITPQDQGYGFHYDLDPGDMDTQEYAFCVSGNFRFVLQVWSNPIPVGRPDCTFDLLLDDGSLLEGDVYGAVDPSGDRVEARAIRGLTRDGFLLWGTPYLVSAEFMTSDTVIPTGLLTADGSGSAILACTDPECVDGFAMVETGTVSPPAYILSSTPEFTSLPVEPIYPGVNWTLDCIGGR